MGDAPTPPTYRTVTSAGRAELAVDGSRFLAVAAHVETVEAAQDQVITIREEHEDATHHVFAYRIRPRPLTEHGDDDGEPSGSAGGPVLNRLEKETLENALVVVTRYYGGTNLGVGRLARAYGRAAGGALEAATIEAVEPQSWVRLTVAYDDSGAVRGIVESVATEFEASYRETVVFDARVPRRALESFRDRLRSATAGRVEFG